jgi:CRP-like cAMP-binding protein
MIGKTSHLLSLTKYLLAFIFCGVILGETISLSMVVTVYGSEIVGKLYLVNALLLLLLPLIFFKYIDKINRGKLLANTNLIIIIILVLFAIVYHFFDDESMLSKLVTAILYPVSYLSKTLLFLTYWTYLNDIYNIQESKKYFPVIAAWGFGGAVAGVVFARGLIALLPVKSILFLWIAVYSVAWFLCTKIRFKAKRKLRSVEGVPEVENALYGIGILLKNKFVAIIAIIYFATFLSIFTMDFLFWKNCYLWCKTTASVASFQFTFFIIHAGVTIALLRFVLPSVINKIGLTRIMYGLPMLFVVGGLLMIVIEHQQVIYNKMLLFAGVQFFRQILFEVTFASSYQMFFAVVVREQRGRAKTLLEGIVKPLAIFTSGAIVVIVNGNVNYLIGMIVILGLLLSAIIYYLRLVYITTIMQQSQAHMEISEIVDLAGQSENAAFYHIVKGYINSNLEDMKIMAIQLLQKAGTAHAFTVIVEMYENESNLRIKEMIAHSLTVFYSYRTRSFVERLLQENNNRIRANTIYSLNLMQCNWKKHLKPLVAPLLFDNDQRVQLEVAFFLWQYGTVYERNTVQQFMRSLLTSNVSNRQAAGIYLTGLLKCNGWEKVLLEHLSTASLQVFTKSIEVIFKNASQDIIQKTLSIIDDMPRRNVSIAGKIMMRHSVNLMEPLLHYFPKVKNRRVSFEIVACLRNATDAQRLNGKKINIGDDALDTIRSWILREIEIIYCDAYHFYNLLNEKNQNGFSTLQDSLRERQTRLCGWAISAMVIMDTKGILIWRSADMDINEVHKRNDLVEVLESMPQDKIGLLILPLLKGDSWDSISRVAKLYFHFDKNERCTCINYFLRSENRLIVLSMLYILEKNYQSYTHRLDINESLAMLEKNSDERISAAAGELFGQKNGDIDKHSRAFNLLEQVLFFKKCTLFHNISADKLLRIVELVHLAHYQKNEVVSAVGHLSDQVYIIKTGLLQIEHFANGENLLLRLIGPGEIYGEAGLFSKVSRTTTAIAAESTDVFILKRADMRRLIREIPDLALNFLETLSVMLCSGGDEVLKIKDNTYSVENE